MSNYILKYSRGESVKYVSHLDFVRLFHRAVRRSGIPFMFSQGFNPHPIMTVGMPLSVGVTADGELMKVGFDGDFSEAELKQRLNAALPDGYSILRAYKLNAKEIDITRVDKADYTVCIEHAGERVLSAADIEKLFEESELNVMKRSKSGTKETDIRPYIYSMSIDETDGNVQSVKMRLACGNAFNLKPDTVIEAINKYITGVDIQFISVHRNCLLCDGQELL